MRSILFFATGLALVASGCHCGNHLTTLAPKLVITQPTTKAGNDWKLDFGTVTASGTASVTLPIVVSNQGSIAAAVSSITLRTGSNPAFTVAPIATPANVGGGGSLAINVTYEPRQAGSAVGFVDLTTTDPNLPAATVDLIANGVSGNVQVCVQDPASSQWTCTGATTPSLTVDFGNVLVGSGAASRQVQVRNIGNSDLQYLGTALNAASSPEFSLAPLQNVAKPLPAGQNVQFAVQFTPTAYGAVTGTAVVYTSDVLLPTVNIQLKAEPVVSQACHMDVSPNPVDFGTVPTGGGFGQQTLVAVNDGLQNCQVTALAMSGSPTFTLQSPPALPVAVAPNGIVVLTVQYQPTTAGTADQGLLTLTSTAGDLLVPLKGTGATPAPCQIQAVPSSLAFGQTGVGIQTSKTITLWNFGTTTCLVLSVQMATGSSPAFTVGSGGFVPFIDPGQSAGITVTYFPHKGGNDTGTVQIIASDNPLTPHTTSVPVSGSAESPSLCLIPQSLDFGTVTPGTLKDLVFQAQNCGPVPLEIRGIYMGQGSSSSFSLGTIPNMPTTLAPGVSTPVTVHYIPANTGGDLGQVVVASNDGTQPTATVRLIGNVVNACAAMISCTPTPLFFPDTATGQTSTLTFTCANVGTAAVPISAIVMQAGSPASFSVSVPGVTSLLPGQAVRVSVDFSPTTAGAATGTVEIDSGDCRAPKQLITLNATGYTPNYPPCTASTVFSPKVKWQWNSSPHEPLSNQVYGQPMVAPLIDTNGDGLVNEKDVPAVVFTTIAAAVIQLDGGFDPSPPGIMRAIRGDTGAEIWSNTDPQYRVFSTYQPAVADIDGDNLNEIVTGLYYESQGNGIGGQEGKFVTGRLICFRSDGSVKWLSDWWTQGNAQDIEDDSAISIADLNGDGVPEIILGARVFDAEGKLLWVGSAGQGDMFHGAVSAIADLDGDGKMEVIGGNTAYHSDGTIYWQYGKDDAFPLVVDVDGDGKPEVVLRNQVDQFEVLNFDGTLKYGPFTYALPTDPQTGQTASICPATITAADFDGDGHPEIGIPAGATYYAYRADGGLMWSHPIQDYQGQCGAAGTGAFDFNGKGAFAAVYNDAENVYAFNGKDGTVMYQQARNSATIIEVPVIADLDNDGHADILITQSATPALIALNNVDNNWPATRPIWNQHTYHVTNIAAGGSVPRVEGPGWKTFNAYRANVTLCK